MMRRIDGKFVVANTITGVNVIKPSNGEVLPEDEPFFLLRARDHLAVCALRDYRARCVADGCTDYHLRGLDEEIEKFEQFAREHPERMKQPGITRGK